MTPEDSVVPAPAAFPLPPLPHDAAREVRGALLAAREKGVLALSPATYRVISQHATGNRDSYVVSFPEGCWRCTCEDFLLRHLLCKHAFAVRAHVLGAPHLPPSPPRRRTYPQTWSAYTQGQLSEFRLFHTLLFDLVGGVQDPRPPLTLGRPRLPFRDVLFCAVQKVYAQRSLRRAYGLFELAAGIHQIRHAPSFVLPAQLLRREDVTPILEDMVAQAALPLAALEESFAVDSSGFRTTSFGAYCQEAHGPSRKNIWVKAHIIVGVRTHVIPKVIVTLAPEGDVPQFPGLVRGTVAAGVKVDTLVSVCANGPKSVALVGERTADIKTLRLGPWIKGRILLADLGYYSHRLSAKITEYEGFFVSRGKENADPLFVHSLKVHRGRAIDLDGKRLSEVLPRLDRGVLDAEVELSYKRRVYSGRRSSDTLVCRLVAIWSEKDGKYHVYLTNIAPEHLSAEEVACLYSLRWEIELTFKELKTSYALDKFKTTNEHVMEALIWTALLTLVASRRLHNLVRARALPEHRERYTQLRWGKVFRRTAQNILDCLLVHLGVHPDGTSSRRSLRAMSIALTRFTLDPHINRARFREEWST